VKVVIEHRRFEDEVVPDDQKKRLPQFTLNARIKDAAQDIIPFGDLDFGIGIHPESEVIVELENNRREKRIEFIKIEALPTILAVKLGIVVEIKDEVFYTNITITILSNI
jgi:hypothetical protein